MTDRLGEVLEGKYRLVKLLGKGGMGEVYEAEHTVINRTVAVKLLRARYAQDELAANRFIREAKAASAIKHHNILEIQDVGRTDDGSVFIVMELLEGQSLADLIKKEAPLPSKRALGIVLEVLDGLAAAHNLGIVHRDLKPDNIMLVDIEGQDQERVKLVDFGISKILGAEDDESDDPALTTTGVTIGTPYYMAPEQIRDSKDVDERIDLWAVGVILYQMLSGELPFRGGSASELLAKILIDPAPRLAGEGYGVSENLSDVVHKSLSKSRDNRHSSSSELSDALRNCNLTSSGATSSTASKHGARVANETVGDDGDPFDPQALTQPEEAISSQGGSAKQSPFAPTVASLEESVREREHERESVEHAGTEEEGIESHGPLWKRILWYFILSPIIAAPILTSLRRPTWVFTALGLPQSLPDWVAWLITTSICVGLLVAAVRVDRFWRTGVQNRWFHGYLFVVFPASALLLTLWHYFTLRGQTASYWLTLRSYMEVDSSQAQDLSRLISESTDRFLVSTTLDLLGTGALAFIVLLGFIFIPRPSSVDPRGWKRWLLVPGGLALIILFQAVLFSEALGFMGIFVILLYLIWIVTAIITLRLRPDSALDSAQASAITLGVMVTVAATGSQIAFGYVQLAEMMIPSSAEDLPPGDREWIYNSFINPSMVRGLIVEWCLLLILFGATFLISRWRAPRHDDQREVRSSLLARIVVIALTALPLALVLVVAAEAGFQWATLKVATMEPSSTSVDGPRSFYIDRRPQPLHAGRRGLLAALTEETRSLRDEVTEPLSKLLSGRPSCGEIVNASLRPDGEAAPARCVTGIEARLYCEGLGKRLPTREEWLAAVEAVEVSPLSVLAGQESNQGELLRGPFGEWTMRMVHGTPTFEICGADAAPAGVTISAQLPPDEHSPHVGFRCAWSLDDPRSVSNTR